MLSSARPPRSPSKLSDSVQHKLNLYALAASAGLGVLALAQPAEGKIVYTPASVGIFPPHGRYRLDLNHDGITDFTLVNRTTWSDIQFNYLGLTRARGSNGAIGCATSGGWRFDSALKAGARIGTGHRFLSRTQGWLLVSSGFTGGTTSPFGPWYNVMNRYLGLRFAIKGQTHYGWARLSVTRAANRSIRAHLTGYAYETIPNKAIIAGKTTDVDLISVQTGSLGRLAQGWPPLACWQR